MEADRSDAGLIDVLDRVLDKGVVIDAHVRVAIVGVELVAVEARVVVASIETYLVHAEALAYTGLAARPTGMRDALPPAAPDPGSGPPTGVPPLIAERIDVEPQQPIAVERAEGMPEADGTAEVDEAE